jgi:ketosteroid isomerase-like protein
MNRKKVVPMTTKKATKNVAKKTYPKKKSSPTKSKQSKRITIDDLAAVVADTEARMARAREETERAVRESEARIAKSREETDKVLQKLTNDVREMSKAVGHVGGDIGELMEFIVIPKIRLAMNATGKHTFNTMQTEKKLKKIDELGEKKTLTEVDVLLYGDTEVMAVETKSHLVTRDVRKHKERLDILRQNEDLIDIQGKKLIGAVVGAIVDEGAKDFALENGLYVVKIREEEEKLDVIEPETCKTW